MWSEPVTLGGGMTMVNGSASGRDGRNRPFASQWAYQRDSIVGGVEGFGELGHGLRLAVPRCSINLVGVDAE